MPFRAEEQILLAVARRELDGPSTGEVRELARVCSDWDYLLATAFSHGLLPLLQKNLTATAADVVPGPVLARARR